jgi:hypothetical protein
MPQTLRRKHGDPGGVGCSVDDAGGRDMEPNDWMSHRAREEIEYCLKVHKSVKEELKSSPIILSTPNREQLHPLHLPNKGYTRTRLSPEGWRNDIFIRVLTAGYKVAADLSPPVDDRELALREEWFEGGDHKLLMRMLSEGRVPYAWRERNYPDNPVTTTIAYKTARERGYSVPEKFLTNREVSFSEREAFYAGHMIARGHFRELNPYLGDIEGKDPSYKDRYVSFRSTLCQLTGQFIVPDPLEEWKAPYLLDQLWIMLYPNRKVRLVGLEIDGELHLEPEKRANDRKRDIMLAAMGYEIYHVAGWWCRIDPFRVICEFLSASNLLPDANQRPVTSRFQTINEYICDYCGNPLYRRDEDWIEEIEYEGRSTVMHGGCVEMATYPP